MNSRAIIPIATTLILMAAESAHAVVYCNAVGVPKGCVVRPVAGVGAGAPGVGVARGVGVGAPGVGVRPGVGLNAGGPVNRVGPR